MKIDDNDHFEIILELLAALQALPSDMEELQAMLERVEYNNELQYAVLKEQNWLLKDQQSRLEILQTKLSTSS